jgi:hypothetical protein
MPLLTDALAQRLAGDRDVHVQLVNEAGAFIDGNDRAQRGVRLQQQVQAGLQPATGNRRGADQRDEAFVQVGVDAAEAVADLLQRLANAVLQQAARHGQLHTPPLAPEQRLADLLLQLRNLVADGGLRDAQLLGRARIAAQPRSRLETDQELEGGQPGVGHGAHAG